MSETSNLPTTSVERVADLSTVNFSHTEADIMQMAARLSVNKQRVLTRVIPLLIGTSLFLAACQTPSSVRSIDTNPTMSPGIHSTYEPVGTQTPNPEGFDNFLPIQKDSLNSSSFRNFIGNPERLIDAWTVAGSIYVPWFKTETLESIKYAPKSFLPRWSEFELRSLALLDTPYIIKKFGRNSTAIILDSGGAHSIAMAYELAKDGGWQPVPMLRGIPCTHCALSGSDQDLATALYPASEMLKVTSRLPKAAPPAFVWDAHRDDLPLGKGEIDNSYAFQLTDMPSVKFLKQQGITNIIYINEGPDTTITPWGDVGSDSDSAQILRSYQNGGLQVYRLGIPPTR